MTSVIVNDIVVSKANVINNAVKKVEYPFPNFKADNFYPLLLKS